MISQTRFASVITSAVMLISLTATVGIKALADPPPPPPPTPDQDFSPTPGTACLGTNDLPEVTQGRAPLADYSPSPGYPGGRASLGYTCNASEVSHIGSAADGTGASGGYRVYRYVDAAGRVCAFYDTTLLFPVNAYAGRTNGTGVWVLDMTDPANPVHTATLSTPAMQSPHESFSINVARGLVGAVFANPAFYHGQFDLYDISQDCTHPELKSTLPMGILGHEGSFAPDGLTYYASSLYGHTLTAIDVSNTLLTKTLWTSLKWNVHGMNLSDDGNTLYFADLARNGANSLEIAGTETKGLTILDVHEIQERKLNPQVTILSHLTWPHVGTPQTAIPIAINDVTGTAHSALVEIDEFGGVDNVGAARIIYVDDPTNPRVLSNMRLAINNKEYQSDPEVQKDPNTTNSLQGYRGHYCSVPRKVNPELVACSFILSGLRVFDIRDPEHPKEIAYFNKPATTGFDPRGPQGAYAMSQPAFDLGRHDVWYSDGNSGFYVVHINDGVWPSGI